MKPHVGFYGWGIAATLAAFEEAVRDGRVVIVASPDEASARKYTGLPPGTSIVLDDPVSAPTPIAALISGPITLKVSKPKSERCFERPHKKWPVRR